MTWKDVLKDEAWGKEQNDKDYQASLESEQVLVDEQREKDEKEPKEETFSCGCGLGMTPDGLEHYPCDKYKKGEVCEFAIQMAQRYPDHQKRYNKEKYAKVMAHLKGNIKKNNEVEELEDYAGDVLRYARNELKIPQRKIEAVLKTALDTLEMNRGEAEEERRADSRNMSINER